MRLYLSSFRLGRHGHRLQEMAAGGQRVAVVCNAMDAEPEKDRTAAGKRELALMSSLGLEAEHVDLRLPRPGLADEFDVVWVRGGNTFVLRRALAIGGNDRVVVEAIANNEIVYAGYSAGACVLASDLTPLSAIDSPAQAQSPIMEGLGVLDRPLVPHVNSPGHPESRLCTSVAADLAARGIEHVALRDGEVLIVEHGSGPTILN